MWWATGQRSSSRASFASAHPRCGGALLCGSTSKQYTSCTSAHSNRPPLHRSCSHTLHRLSPGEAEKSEGRAGPGAPCLPLPGRPAAALCCERCTSAPMTSAVPALQQTSARKWAPQVVKDSWQPREYKTPKPPQAQPAAGLQQAHTPLWQAGLHMRLHMPHPVACATHATGLPAPHPPLGRREVVREDEAGEHD